MVTLVTVLWLHTLASPAAAPATAIPDSLPAEAVPNYRVIEKGIAAAGQPSVETLARLKELGFKTVINLRPTDEAPVVVEEKRILEGQGLRYVSVPVTPATFSASDVESISKLLGDPESAPVLLHCSSSNRVGAVWGVIARQRGRSLEEAEAEARRAGLTSPAMIEAFRKVAADVVPVAHP